MPGHGWGLHQSVTKTGILYWLMLAAALVATVGFFLCIFSMARVINDVVSTNMVRRLPLSMGRYCSDDSGLWVSVPQGVELWVSVYDSGWTVLHKNAVMFLETAPDPSVALESFADLTSPTSWSGSLANIWQARADAFGELIHHPRADISDAARDIHERLMLMIERQRDREQQEDRKGEQRFE